MSRIGRKPIPIPKDVKVNIQGNIITVNGPKGTLKAEKVNEIDIEINGQEIVLKRASDEKRVKALHGLWRALIANMITGVSQGFQKKLEIVGVGYKAEAKGKGIQLALGYSHPIYFSPPEGIKIEVPSPTSISISGIDKHLVGLVAAKIRSFRPPEPYKGKGIRYEGEYVRRKAGKAAASAGAK
ncbi:MAG: LSU ribosomal protein L6p (L9e) [Ignavibacteriae bacterium]|nr:MAG: LSU ribosomal protein L6p (L9e) [Ignavibacteriota bacterium]